MSNPAYVKSEPGKWAREGVREAELKDFISLSLESQRKVEEILDEMENSQLVVFRYDGSDRLVAPFVVGVSSKGNPLMKGYQIEGGARSGKGKAWKVFKVGKMENLANFWDFFNGDEFDFDESYPWIYKVFKMLEGG